LFLTAIPPPHTHPPLQSFRHTHQVFLLVPQRSREQSAGVQCNSGRRSRHTPGTGSTTNNSVVDCTNAGSGGGEALLASAAAGNVINLGIGGWPAATVAAAGADDLNFTSASGGCDEDCTSSVAAISVEGARLMPHVMLPTRSGGAKWRGREALNERGGFAEQGWRSSPRRLRQGGDGLAATFATMDGCQPRQVATFADATPREKSAVAAAWMEAAATAAQQSASRAARSQPRTSYLTAPQRPEATAGSGLDLLRTDHPVERQQKRMVRALAEALAATHEARKADAALIAAKAAAWRNGSVQP
jgi:hypothetical protein